MNKISGPDRDPILETTDLYQSILSTGPEIQSGFGKFLNFWKCCKPAKGSIDSKGKPEALRVCLRKVAGKVHKLLWRFYNRKIWGRNAPPERYRSSRGNKNPRACSCVIFYEFISMNLLWCQISLKMFAVSHLMLAWAVMPETEDLRCVIWILERLGHKTHWELRCGHVENGGSQGWDPGARELRAS